MEIIPRLLPQPHSLDQLVQHLGQLRSRCRGSCQFLPLLAAVEKSCEPIVRCGDQLQRLSHIVTRHYQ
jgi:hypothetical protein